MSSLQSIPTATFAERPATVSLISPLPIDLFDVGIDADRHAGRSAVRATVLAMTPIGDESPLLPGPLRRHDGAFWGVQGDNGLTLAMRTASFASAVAARRDAVEVLARSSKFEFVPVRAGANGRMSFWVLLNGRVVLVGGQSWRQAKKSSARRLVQTLSRLPRL